jgi:primosomal protein N'
MKDISADENKTINIIDVIPIARGISVEKLTYFSSRPIAQGSIVSIPVRKKTLPAVVIGSEDAMRSKTQIRNASFEIKKISSLQAKPFFLPGFIRACIQAAEYFATTTGSILYTFSQQNIFGQIDGIKNTPVTDNNPTVGTIAPEKYILQVPDDERYSDYKGFIREQFAHKVSVFFCLPSVQEAENTGLLLEKGIEEYTYVLHSELSTKELIERYKKILAESHPVLIIATGTFLSIPRTDIGAIVIEKENSRGWKTLSRPYIDIRIFAGILAGKIGAKFVMGDLFLSSETLHHYYSGDFLELRPLKFRLLSDIEQKIVDMRDHKIGTLSDEMLLLIKKNRERNEHLFIFTARKGLSPTTVCVDCGNIITCNSCGNPTVLHTRQSSKTDLISDTASPENNFFLCHHCGERRKADDLCKVCGGWRLKTLGVGTELIAQEIEQFLPEATLFIFDKEHMTTRKKARTAIAQFYRSPGSIIIGTEMALDYLNKPIENMAVASIDSFFSIPDYRMSEKILSILLKMRTLAQKQFLIQTRDPEQSIFEHTLRGNLFDFYREELELRKTFKYPPFSVFIKISLEGKRDAIAQEMARAKKFFENFEKAEDGFSFDVFPSFVKGLQGNSILHALIKVPASEWPNQKLLEKLNSLPAQYLIKVDPESLL